jgi:hypothetical protein
MCDLKHLEIKVVLINPGDGYTEIAHRGQPQNVNKAHVIYRKLCHRNECDKPVLAEHEDLFLHQI